MKNSILFSAEALQKVELFSKQFTTLDPDHEDSREKVSSLLCFLLCDVIEEALENEQGLEKTKELQVFEKGLLELLEDTVPPVETAAEFLKSFIIFSLEEEESLENEQFLKEEIEKIERCFNEQMQKLYQSAQQVNQEIKQKFDSLKQRTKVLNASRESISEEMNAKLDSLTLKIEEISKTLEGLSLEQDEIGKRMVKQQNNLDKMTTDYENFLKKVNL